MRIREIQSNQNKTKKKPISKLKLMILSVITAIVLWVVVVQIVNPEIVYEIKNVPVKVLGEGTLRDRSIVLMNKDKLPEFNVKISGRRNEVISAMNRVRVNIDVSQVTQLGSFAVTPTVYVPSSINIEQQNIGDVILEFEECTTKEVPVVAGYSGLSKNKIIEVETELDSITVTGAVSQINKLAKCLITVDASGVEKEFENTYEFVYSDANGEALEECQTFFCNVSSVKAKSRVYDKVQIPFKVENSEAMKNKYVIEIDESSISGYVDGGLRVPFDVIPEAEYIIEDGSYDAGRRELTAVLREISGIFIPEKSIKVYGTVTKLKSKRAHVSIEAVNIPEGMAVSFEHSITTDLTMPEETAEPVKGVVDLTGKQPGEYDVPVIFEDNKIFAKDLTVKVSIAYE